MPRNQIMCLFIKILIFKTILKVSSKGIDNNLINDYYRLEFKKFQGRSNWNIDAINKNTDYSSYSLFWHKQNASCYLFQIESTSENLIIEVLTRDLIIITSLAFSARAHGNILNVVTTHDNERGCPDQQEIQFLYTDYLNVIVLLGHDSWSGPHIIILKSTSTTLTYKALKDLVNSKVNPSLDYGDLIKVESLAWCNMTRKTEEEFMNSHYFKCRKYIQFKKSEQIRRILLSILTITGVVWITLSVLYWIRKRRARAVVAPE